MIYARRTSQTDAPPIAASAATPTLPPGAFAFYIGGGQVSGTVTMGDILAGSTSTLTLRVQNDGQQNLPWSVYELTGYASSWFTNTDGAALELTPGDYQDLVFRVVVPSTETAATRLVQFAFTAGTLEATLNLYYDVKVPVVEPDVRPPVAPVNVVATGGDGIIDVQWDGAATATTYLVAGSTTQGGPYSTFQHQVATTYKRVTSVSNGTRYYIVVYSQNADTGTSAPSAEVSVVPVKPPDPDPDPTLDAPVIASVSVGSTFCVPRWSAVATADTYYVRVYNTSGTKVAEAATSALTALVTGLTASSAYDVKVSAYDAGLAIESPESTAYRITTASAGGSGPGTPALPRADTMTVHHFYSSLPTNPFAVTNNIRKAPAISLAGTATPLSLGQLAADACEQEPIDHRLLILLHVGTGRPGTTNIYAGQTPYSFVESQGYALDSVWTEIVEQFAGAFVGKELPRIMIDEEATGYAGQGPLLPFWDYQGSSPEERASKFVQLFANATLKARLPLPLRNATVDDLALIDARYTHPNSILAGHWDHYIKRERARSMVRIVTDAFERVTGRRPIVFNYDDERRTRMGAYFDGLPRIPGDRAMSTISNIPCYIQTPQTVDFTKYGNSHRVGKGLAPLTKAVRWNNFIDHLNDLRAMKDGNLPAVAALRYNGDWDTDYTGNPNNAVEQLKHMGAMGIDRIVWFDTTATQDKVDEMQSVVERVQVYAKPTKRLPVIPYDADSVTTGAITTVYDEAEWTAGGTDEIEWA